MEFYIGQILMGGWNFAPRNTIYANGQTMSINQNTALFSLYGTIYGGDGRTTFGLPDLGGRVTMSSGQGPGLSNRAIGQKGGTKAYTLSVANMPSHSHTLLAAPGTATSGTADGNALAHEARGSADVPDIYENGTPSIAMHSGSVSSTGGGSPVNNLQPYLVIGFFVALQGIYPSRP